MNITRKEFLRACTLAAGGLMIKSNGILSQIQEKKSGFIKLRDGFGIYLERGGTIAWYTSNDGVAVVDSQFPDSAKNFIAALQKVTTRKIDVLFNTHHHGDHTLGNTVLKDYALRITAHENCVENQKKNAGNDSNKPQVYADTTYTDIWTAALGKEKVTAKYFGRAHTGGDSVIHFENLNIVHTGDLVFNRTFPYIDLASGGSITNWMSVLENISKYYSKETLYIFGHGVTNDHVTGSVKDVLLMRDYLSALRDYVAGEIKNGKTKEQVAAAEGIPGFKDMKELKTGIKKMNLEKMYEELSGK